MTDRALTDLQSGRVNQKWRTRTALLEAAANLVEQGKQPSIADVADAARVSRATAYRYFPNQDKLLIEATNQNSILPALEGVAAKIPDSPDVALRLDGLVQAFQSLVTAHEPALRTLLRLTLEGDGGSTEGVRTRGSARAQWLDDVLAPLEAQLGVAAHAKLTAALSLCMGLEAQLVLCDIHHLSPAEAEEICRWAAGALLEKGIAEALGR